MSGRVAASVAAGLALLAAGCGGSGDTGGGDGSWGQRADAVCDRAEKTLRGLDPPEDIGDLDRVMVRASEEIRAAIAEIRKLDASDEEKAHAKPFLDDLALVEQRLDGIGDATSTGERRPIEKAGRSLRLDAVDIAAHAEEAGLTRCGREPAGVAAADALLLPTYAEYVAESHTRFVLAERVLARRWDPEGAAGERARYWVALWALVERTERGFSEPPEGELEAIQSTHGDAFRAMKDAADVYSSIAKGEVPLTSERISEASTRRRVKAFEAAGFELLEQLGPAGRAQLRDLDGLPGDRPGGATGGGSES